MTITNIVARKIEGQWEAALLSDGRFIRALVGKDLYKLVSPLLLPYLQSNHPDDTEIGLTINVATPQPKEVKNDN